MEAKRLQYSFVVFFLNKFKSRPDHWPNNIDKKIKIRRET